MLVFRPLEHLEGRIDLSERAEQLSAELATLVPSEAPDAVPEETAEELAALESDVASRVAGAELALEGELSTARLRDLEACGPGPERAPR